MRREIIIHGLFLASASAFTFWASQDAPEASSTEHALFGAAAASIANIRYQDLNQTVSVTPGDGFYWIEVSSNAQNPATSNQGSPANAQLNESKTQRFVAGSQIEQFLKNLDPLIAERVIGKVEESKLGEYGIDDKSPRLEVFNKNGEKYELKLGKKAFGSSNRYAKYDNNGNVLLLRSTLVEGIESAPTKLIERKLFKTEPSGMAGISVSRGGQTQKFYVSKPATEESDPVWGRSQDEKGGDKELSAWINKFDKLRSKAYASAEQEKALGNQKPILTIEFESTAKIQETVDFFKVKSTEIPNTDSSQEYSYWAKIGRFMAFVSIDANRISAIEQDMGKILGEKGALAPN